jgi:hypothetical protein
LAFAAKYQLDAQQVYQAQVTHYVNAKIDEENCPKLLEALTKITDCGFVATACLRATMPDLDHTLELLKYGHKRVVEAQGDQQLKDQLRQARLRLDTYRLVEVALESDWQEFYRGYLMLELISLLNSVIENYFYLTILKFIALFRAMLAALKLSGVGTGPNCWSI